MRRALPQSTLLLLLLPAMATGCAAGWRFGGGPVTDTRGGVGLLGAAGCAAGVKLKGEQALVITLDAGIGPSLRSEAGFLGGAQGIQWLHQELAGSRIGLRAGYRFRYLWRFGRDDGERHAAGWGGALALLVVLDERYEGGGKGGSGRTWTNLAIDLEGLWLARISDAYREGGLFLLTVSYETNVLSRL